MVIYKTTNLINGKIYVGQDKYNNCYYKGSGLKLRSAIRKYGIDNFKKEILEHCSSKEHMDAREKYWISELNSRDNAIGYNIAGGGEGFDLSLHPDKTEIYKRIAASNRLSQKGKTHKKRTLEQNLALSKALKGRKFSDEHRKNIGLSSTGRVVSAETRLKMSKTLSGRKFSEQAILRRCKKISVDGVEFISLKQAIFELSISSVKLRYRLVSSDWPNYIYL